MCQKESHVRPWGGAAGSLELCGWNIVFRFLLDVPIMTSSRTQAVGDSYFSSIQNSSRSILGPTCQCRGHCLFASEWLSLDNDSESVSSAIACRCFSPGIFVRQASISFVVDWCIDSYAVSNGQIAYQKLEVPSLLETLSVAGSCVFRRLLATKTISGAAFVFNTSFKAVMCFLLSSTVIR